MPSTHEHLTAQFYKWEQRGRGWQVFEEPVYPEPPFVEFEGHYLPDEAIIDPQSIRLDLDGRLAEFLRRGCASDRDTRFKTAAEMRTELREIRTAL